MASLSWGHPKTEKPLTPPEPHRKVVSFFDSPQINMFRLVAEEKYDLRRWEERYFYVRLKEKVADIWKAIKEGASEEEVNKNLVALTSMCYQYYESHQLSPKIDLVEYFWRHAA